MAITTRKLDQGTYNKAEAFFRQSECLGDAPYQYLLNIQGDMGEILPVSAAIQLQGNRINVKNIWSMVRNHQKTLVTRNPGGERGRDAKILSEKYLNRFLEHLATVDTADIDQNRL